MSANPQENEKLPSKSESYWLKNLTVPSFHSLQEDKQVDVVIVGGGITGLTTAYLLGNEGLKVAVLEADRVLNGTTGHTTAKITAQHGLIYDELVQNAGEHIAKCYYEANTEALHFIHQTIRQHKINCDFLQQDAYVYATTEQYAQKIQKEADAYKRLGIDGELRNSIPFEIPIQNALVMKNQAQFHPLKYLAHLTKIAVEKGVEIFEETTAVHIETGEQPVVITRDGARITSHYVLSCSHFPFYEGAGLYSTRMYAERSYVLATKTKKKYPGGMYISADQPTHSLRSVLIEGQEIVLIGGESHKTGQSGDTLPHYEALEHFGEDVLGIEDILYRWSAQDLITLDKIPYIGAITPSQKNILIAIGYRKWGMTNSTAAALLLKDMVLNRKNKFEELYTPLRFHMNPSLKNFIVENANVLSHLIEGKLETPEKSITDLSNDEGAVISLNGHRKGVYRDIDGKLHMVDTTCTHIGCEVQWNNSERTWDCPCHGSRFSYTGEVVEGPAEKPLQKYDYTMLDNLTSGDSGY